MAIDTEPDTKTLEGEELTRTLHKDTVRHRYRAGRRLEVGKADGLIVDHGVNRGSSVASTFRAVEDGGICNCRQRFAIFVGQVPTSRDGGYKYGTVFDGWNRDSPI